MGKGFDHTGSSLVVFGQAMLRGVAYLVRVLERFEGLQGGDPVDQEGPLSSPSFINRVQVAPQLAATPSPRTRVELLVRCHRLVELYPHTHPKELT